MMNNQPLVSICIPTYNAVEFFEPCLQSAVEQTYQSIEILISDDGSTDETIAIAKKFVEKYSQVRIVKNAQKGMVSNWNNCIEQAKGDWIKFLFQDDILKPACVEKMLHNCQVQNVQIGLCRREFIIHDDVPRRVRNIFKYRLVVPERIFGDINFISPERLAAEVADQLPENILGEPTCYIFHKEILNHTNGAFNIEYKQVVDMEFILRLGLFKGLAFSSESLAYFRVHGKSESSANIKEDEESLIRSIAAVTGDTILFFHKILNDPTFKLVKEAMGEDVIQLYINQLYYSGCRNKGKKIFNQALEPIRKKYNELGEMDYSYFKYKRYKKLFRQWESETRW
jgi:glycosyltransferase involved in cell wall biosynthesis